MHFLERIEHLPPEYFHPWFYWAVLAVSLLEPLPVIGSFMPGQSLVLLGGLLSRNGSLDLHRLILASAAGAILGDLAGYLLGRRFGEGLIIRFGKYILLKRERFEKVKAWLHAHTGPTLILGRFNSVARSFSPFLAGSTHVGFVRFLVYNILGGVAWAFLFAWSGFAFGKGIEVAAHYIGEYLLIAAILSLVILLLYRLEIKRRRIIYEKHIFPLILNIASLYLFCKLAGDVAEGEAAARWDDWIGGRSASPGISALHGISLPIAIAMRPVFLALPSLGLLAEFLRKRDAYKAAFILLAMGGGILLTLAMQALERRLGWDPGIGPFTDSAFPSLPAATAALLSGSVLHLFRHRCHSRYGRILFPSACVAFILLAGLARVFAQADRFTAAAGGISLGLFWVTLLILFLEDIVPDKGKEGFRRRPVA